MREVGAFTRPLPRDPDGRHEARDEKCTYRGEWQTRGDGQRRGDVQSLVTAANDNGSTLRVPNVIVASLHHSENPSVPSLCNQYFISKHSHCSLDS